MFVFYIFVSLMLLASGTTALKCRPGHTYNDGCNDCTCTSKGDAYACTKKLCPDNPIVCYTPGSTTGCQTGHRYNDGCNWCTCVDGRGYACTKIGCRDNPVVCYVK